MVSLIFNYLHGSQNSLKKPLERQCFKIISNFGTKQELTTGSEKAPVQRAKQIRGWEFGRPNFALRICLSSQDFFLKAAERMVSSHCKLTADKRRVSILRRYIQIASDAYNSNHNLKNLHRNA